MGKFVGEFCAPVVVTVTTAEVENICQKNGLLLHELLSAFGHLDSINSVVRTGSGTLPVTDAHIRFERVTELKPKTSTLLEEVNVFLFFVLDWLIVLSSSITSRTRVSNHEKSVD